MLGGVVLLLYALNFISNIPIDAVFAWSLRLQIEKFNDDILILLLFIIVRNLAFALISKLGPRIRRWESKLITIISQYVNV